MFRKMVSLALAVLMAAMIVFTAAAEGEWIMYVYTENGRSLNVRREPATGNNIISTLQYGDSVHVLSVSPDGWTAIEWAKADGGVAYVQSRFLVDTKPGKSARQLEEEEKKRNLEELNRQTASFRTVEKSFTISVRATRTSGWINFREGPGVAAKRISTLPDGRLLTVVGETDKWYQAIDQETGTTGYISKTYVTVLAMPEGAEASGKEKLGKLDVNGEFTIMCQLPENYELGLVDAQGMKIVASIMPTDKEKPILYLSIAFDDIYSDVERMNDLGEEDLKVLEESFTQLNDVEITYRETAYGTKLLIARETGEDTDFVDILSVYKGYFVEFVMTPNPEASRQELTGEQIQMCIDFLSEVDFVPAGT